MTRSNKILAYWILVVKHFSIVTKGFHNKDLNYISILFRNLNAHLFDIKPYLLKIIQPIESYIISEYHTYYLPR